MKKFIMSAVLLAGLGCGSVFAAAAAPPAIFFSDLTSGPSTGGKDDQGAIVTIVGKSFGAQQGGGFVTIGGAKAPGCLAWSDSKISFSIGNGAASGDIKVTTDAGTSNGVHFTVRAGAIYFVDDSGPNSPGSGSYADPWRNPSDFIRVMKPGDIAYFRGGAYGSNITLTSGHANGSAGSEISFIGYPGEMPKISSPWTSFDLQDNKQYFVIAGFRLYSDSKNFSLTASHIRVVNNDCESLKSHAYGMIHPIIGSDIQIYGNEFHGATSGNKLDHPIYVGYGADNVDIGWNRIYNNNIDRGPVISVNIDGAGSSGQRFDNIRIHDNWIDCNGARGIGVVCTAAGSSTAIYNNLFTGHSPENVVYVYSGSSVIDNNTFHASAGGAMIQLTTMSEGSYTYKPETIEIRNNIFNVLGGSYFDLVNEGQMGRVSIDHNAYSGAGSGPGRDTAAVNADPKFVDVAGGDFHLSPNSLCVDAGADTRARVAFDKDGFPRPQGAAVDIGAYEYVTGMVVAHDPGPGGPDTNDSFQPLTGGIPVPLNDILVVGSRDRRGTVDPAKGDTAQIYFRGNAPGAYTVRIFTLTGELAWENRTTDVSDGMFEWEPAGMASGIYVVNVKGPGFSASKKLAVLS